MPYNFAADFTKKKLCSRLSSTAILHFLATQSLVASYAVHLRLIGKHVVDVLLVMIELFMLGIRAEVLQKDINRKSAFLRPKFQNFKSFTR